MVTSSRSPFARLLVVEADPADARLLAGALDRPGLEVASAASLGEARRLLALDPVDLVLAAGPLPDGSPLALLESEPAVPLVLLLESVSAEGVRAAFAAGALDVFVKDGALLPLLAPRTERLLQLLADRRILSDLFDENARLAQANALLRELATRDPLTGVLDERGFTDALQLEAARARRSGTPVAVAVFDLDRFRSLNDTRGRDAGDAILRAVGELLRREARGGDVLARLDGDGFAVLLAGTPLSGALRFAERLRGSVEAYRLPWREDALATTVSGGVGFLEEPPETPAALVAWARERVRELKAGGRNRVGILS